LIERDGSSLLIDAGVGAMTGDFVFGSANCGSLIDVLRALGRRPEDIDVVAFTHLHFDHAGWAFTNGSKTFANARYVLAAREWTPYADGSHRPDATTPHHVITELVSGRTAVHMIDDGEEIVPGVHAIVTPGHTPGHTSYVVTSRAGKRLVVFGDAFHMPVQLVHPDWLSAADTDGAAAEAARRRLLDELSQPDTVGFGFHFGDQPFGRLAHGYSWNPVPTRMLAPPPR
jgi:glyoxylase-like metal-dependent hydrolase (beta-lactamase superfamily II)